MLSRLGEIGFIKRKTEQLSRKRAARDYCSRSARGKLIGESDRTGTETTDPIQPLEKEEYLIIDIMDDGTPEVSLEFLDYNLKLEFLCKNSKKAPAKGISGLNPGDKNFVDVPL